MGGIEECEGSSCHGALMEMKASEVRYSTMNRCNLMIAFIKTNTKKAIKEAHHVLYIFSSSLN